MLKVLIVGFAVGMVCVLLKWLFDDGLRLEYGTENLQREYDIIIVGAGTAGSVLTKILSETGRFSVLLLEAGGTVPWWASVPLLVPFLQRSSCDWQFRTESQLHSLKSYWQQQSYWPRGKCLGGTSSLNYMIHLRGMPRCYNKWRNDSECAGWNYGDLLPYFGKCENLRLVRVNDTHSALHGCGSSPLDVTTREECATSELCQAFLCSMQERGYPLGDLNADLEVGVMPIQSNIQDGKRHSVYETYLYPSLTSSNTNLQVVVNSLATKIITYGRKSPRAVGVVFRHADGRLHKVRALREVILSAGVVGSPWLLLLSGIGPKQELAKHGIQQVVDLPVGENLQDHLTLPLYFKLHQDVSTNFNKILQPKTLWDYLVHGKGPLSGTGVEGVARVVLPCVVPSDSMRSAGKSQSQSKPKKHRSDNSSCSESHFILMLFNMGTIDSTTYARNTNFKEETFKYLFPGVSHWNNRGFFILLTLTNPRSRGRVAIRTRDASAPPLIQPNYLQDETDVRHFVKGINFVASLAQTAPFRKLGAALWLPDLPNCEDFHRAVSDDDYLDCWIRSAAMTGYHPSGTCPMGCGGSSSAVVDSELRVRGVESLSVVDASIFPSPTTGLPQAAVVALAEKTAHDILNRLENRRD